jgi:hypothetical protein
MVSLIFGDLINWLRSGIEEMGQLFQNQNLFLFPIHRAHFCVFLIVKDIHYILNYVSRFFELIVA